MFWRRKIIYSDRVNTSPKCIHLHTYRNQQHDGLKDIFVWSDNHYNVKCLHLATAFNELNTLELELIWCSSEYWNFENPHSWYEGLSCFSVFKLQYFFLQITTTQTSYTCIDHREYHLPGPWLKHGGQQLHPNMTPGNVILEHKLWRRRIECENPKLY